MLERYDWNANLQRIARLLETGEVGRIIFLSENDDIRSNIGCVNGSTQTITIDIAEYDATGTLLETRTMNLPSLSNKQINQILGDFAPVDGYVDVSSATPGAAFTCYGSVLDNTTSDPTTIRQRSPRRSESAPASGAASMLSPARLADRIPVRVATPIAAPM